MTNASRKKICILHRYPVSEAIGTNPSLPETFAQLRRDGYEIIFVSFHEPKPDKKIPGITYEEFSLGLKRSSKYDVLFKSLLWLLLAPLKCLRLRKKYGVTVFYCDDSGPFYPLFMKIFLGKRCRVFMRFGDLQSGYQLLGKSAWHNFLFKISLWFERQQWKKVDAILPLSIAFRTFLGKQGIDTDKVRVVEESINLKQFRAGVPSDVRHKYHLVDKKVIMFHGAVVRCKGLETFLRAARIVSPERSNVVFMVVGDGAELANLKAMAQKLGLANQVIFTGWIPFAEMPKYVSVSDVGVVMRSSNLANNFVVTTALLQIWATQRPAIAPNLEAIARVVHEGENGVLFQPDDARSLAKQINFLLSNPEMCRKLGAAGRQSARDFEQAHIGQKLATTIESLISQYK